VTDEPVTIGNWSPSNYENSFAGPVTLETALAESINTVAARLADEVGRPKVAETARRLGVNSPVNTDPAMALGTTLVTPLEMAQAYSVLADGGLRNGVYGIERIRTGKGQVLYQRRVEPAPQVVNNPALSDLNQMLHAVVSRGTGTRAAIAGRDVAGKTGTTSDYRDAWFCGFTGGLTTVVWMGRDDNSPMRRITGGIAPAELWRTYMVSAMKRLPTGPIPKGPLPVAPPVAAPAQSEPPPTVAEPVPQPGNSSAPLDLEKLQNLAQPRF
jgi:penicillin-binding protein 1A